MGKAQIKRKNWTLIRVCREKRLDIEGKIVTIVYVASLFGLVDADMRV